MAATTMPDAKASPSPMQVALKEAAMTPFGAIAWGIILVPVGRILLVYNRVGRPMPALIGGAFAFLYLFGGAVIALVFDILVIPFNDYFGPAAGAAGIPMPFADSIIDA